MVEHDAQRLVEVLLRGLTRGHRIAENGLRVHIVIAVNRNHRPDEVWRIMRLRRLPRSGRIGPPGENSRHVLNLRLIVGRNRLPLVVELQRAIGIEQISPNRKQLQKFAAVIFVWQGAGGRIRFVVVHHVEIKAHARRQRDRLHDVFVVPECIPREEVQIRHHSFDRDLQTGDDKNLSKRERDPLAQLIRRVDCVVHKLALRIDDGGHRGRRRNDRWSDALLRAQPTAETGLLQRDHVRDVRSPARLFEESERRRVRNLGLLDGNHERKQWRERAVAIFDHQGVSISGNRCERRFRGELLVALEAGRQIGLSENYDCALDEPGARDFQLNLAETEIPGPDSGDRERLRAMCERRFLRERSGRGERDREQDGRPSACPPTSRQLRTCRMHLPRDSSRYDLRTTFSRLSCRLTLHVVEV